MKNTTLGRKAKTGLEKNEGMYKPRTAKTQMGDGADFAFNGQMGDGVNRAGNRFAGNQLGLTMKENYGLKESQRKGTASDSHEDRMEKIGPSVTKDPNRQTVSTAKEGHPIESGYNKVPHVTNPDKIYITKAAK